MDKRCVGYTETLDRLVVALCRDYGRRSRGNPHRRVEMEFKYINTRMREAVASVIGHEGAERMIEEIGERIGYAYSAFSDVSEVNYKQKKQLSKLAIARGLYLLD